MKHKIELSPQLIALEKEVSPIVDQINRSPLAIDQEQLFRIFNKHKFILRTIRELINSSAEKIIDPESTEEVRRLLYQDMKLPVLSKTPTGVPSVTIEVLKKHLKDFDLSVLRHLISYREVSTVLKHLTILHRKQDSNGVIYPELTNECPTLRLYSYLINLCSEANEVILPPEGSVFVKADYKAQELAIISIQAGEESILHALQAGDDIHVQTARKLFNKENPDLKERHIGKVVNYSIMYGTTDSGLSWKLGISKADAAVILSSWKRSYSQISRWLDEQKETATKNGFLESHFGLKSFIDQVPHEGYLFEKEIRRVINSQVQSTGSFILKTAMKKANESGLKIMLPAHDAITVLSNGSTIDLTINVLRDAMSFKWNDFVFDVDVSVGKNMAFSECLGTN